MTYELWDGATLTAGRYASMLGYEDFERPGLHQYSTAYDMHDVTGLFDALGRGFGPEEITSVSISPGYNQGLKFTYESNGHFFGASLQDSVFNYDNDRFGGDDRSSYGLEVAGALKLAEGLRWFLGGAYEDTEIQDADKNYMLNTYLAYEVGQLTLGAELNYGESESGLFPLGVQDEEVLQGLLVANYAYSDCASVTGRISYSEHDDDIANVDVEFMKYTLAHKWAFSDNLALINEVSYVDGDLGGVSDYESVLGAASLLFTF